MELAPRTSRENGLSLKSVLDLSATFVPIGAISYTNTLSMPPILIPFRIKHSIEFRFGSARHTASSSVPNESFIQYFSSFERDEKSIARVRTQPALTGALMRVWRHALKRQSASESPVSATVWYNTGSATRHDERLTRHRDATSRGKQYCEISPMRSDGRAATTLSFRSTQGIELAYRGLVTGVTSAVGMRGQVEKEALG